jgi:hypothetical protein
MEVQPELTSETPATGSTAQEFSQVVNESKQAIQETVVEPKVKRGRGRPRKSISAGAAPADQPSVASSAAAPGPQAPPDISKHLMGPLILISTIPARRVGIPEIALTPEEAYACASSLNEILVAFAPQGQMNPKTAAIMSAAVVFGSVGITKYQIYMEKSRAPVEREKQEAEEIPNPERPFGTINAEDHFRKK